MMEKINITDAGVVDSIRNKMAVATVTDNGLMPRGLMGSNNSQSSVLLCESNNFAITSSILLSISATTSGAPNLYFIRISRATGMTDPSIRVKVLAGAYEIKIKGKTEVNGTCRIYAERLQFTPVLNVLMMNTVGIVLKMETADNSAFEGGFEATLD